MRPSLALAVALAFALAVKFVPGPAAAATPQVRRITISQMAFGPPPAGLRVGDTVEWVNADLFQHSATAHDGSFDLVLKLKARAAVVLRKPGTLRVYCRYHPGMTATLSVAP